MVNNTGLEYQYAVADESELDELLAGHNTNRGRLWTRSTNRIQVFPGSTGVIWLKSEADKPVQPLVLICHEEDIQRLCGRYAQLRSDLSPLTTWCHLLTPQFFEPLESLVRAPELAGIAAAWTGLIVAEAVLLSELSIASVRVSACLATQSFAIARTNALWGRSHISAIIKRFDSANRLCRGDSVKQRTENNTARIRSSLEPIWRTLAELSQGVNYRVNELNPMVEALQALQKARDVNDKQEADRLIQPLLHYVPEADSLWQLNSLAPEMRLRLFDKLVDGLKDTPSDHANLRHNALAFLAGYLATIAAGGSPSLSLAEGHAVRWPEITAWAYVIGGIGERVVWTSSFDGLGRLVARELLRTLRLDEPPTCDFAFEEAAVLADSKLSDPLVHLRIKQARLLTVALLPGVNVSIPIADMAFSGVGKTESSRSTRTAEPSVSQQEPVAALVNVLWPHLQKRIEDYMSSVLDPNSSQDTSNPQRTRGKRKPADQQRLPLSGFKRGQ